MALFLHLRAHQNIPHEVVAPVEESERRSVIRSARSMSRLRWMYIGTAAAWLVALVVRGARLGLGIVDDPNAWAGLVVMALASVGALSLHLASRNFARGAPIEMNNAWLRA